MRSNMTPKADKGFSFPCLVQGPNGGIALMPEAGDGVVVHPSTFYDVGDIFPREKFNRNLERYKAFDGVVHLSNGD